MKQALPSFPLTDGKSEVNERLELSQLPVIEEGSEARSSTGLQNDPVVNIGL